jgi:hypothetical protein
MKMKTVTVILMSVCLIVPVFAQQYGQRYETEQPKVRFVSLPVYIDSGNRALAAYQFELKTTKGQIKIVGLENGEAPAALAHDKIIIAAFNTGNNLPTGSTRVVSLQLQIIGDTEPQYQLDLTVAADADGNKIPAEITFDKGE